MEYNEQEKNVMKNTTATTEDLDETEDEEVKRNCYGMKFYTTSCSEDETDLQISDTDSENDDDDTSTDDNDSSSTLSTCTESDLSNYEMDQSSHKPQPTKFTFDLSKCDPGIIICRPKPVPFRRKLQFCDTPPNYDEDLSAQSTDEGIENDGSDEGVDETSAIGMSKGDISDDSVSTSSVSSQSSSSTEDEEVESIQAARATLSFDSDDDASVSDNDNGDELKLGEADSSDEESLFYDVDSEYDGEESDSLSLQGDDSMSSTASESSTIDGASLEEQPSFENERKETEIEIEWDELDFEKNRHDQDDATAEVSGSGTATCTEGSSISTEDLENIMDDAEEAHSSDTSFDDEAASRTLEHTKVIEEKNRVQEDEYFPEQKHHSSASHKRSHSTAFGSSLNRIPFLTSLKTNFSASSNCEHLKRVKNSHPDISDCNTEDAVDSQLAEELLGTVSPTSIESKPIPLLTPPASPVPIKSDESVVEIYEWPSGLVVDNALTAAIQLRPLSPSSLARLEENDQCKEPFITVYPRKRSVTRDFSYVGDTGFMPVLGNTGVGR